MLSALIGKYKITLIAIATLIAIGGAAKLYHNSVIAEMQLTHQEYVDRTVKIFEDERDEIINRYEYERDSISNVLNEASYRINEIQELNESLTRKIRKYEINPKFDNLDFLNAADHMSKYKYQPTQ